VWSDLGYLICLRHCLSSRAVKSIFFLFRNYIFPFIRALYILSYHLIYVPCKRSSLCTYLATSFLILLCLSFSLLKKNVDFIIAKSALKFTCLFPVHLGMPYLWWLHMVFFTRLVQGRMVDVYPCAALALDHEIHRQHINNVHKVLSILKKSY